MSNPKILAMVQLPPPIHGASLRNESVMKSRLINKDFNIKILPLKFAKSLKDIRTVNLKKIIKAIVYGIRLAEELVIFRSQIVYFTLSPTGIAFYRDSFYVVILKLFRTRILFHLHGKGIEKKQTQSLMVKSMYKFIFNKTSVICLSNNHAKDILNIYSKKPYIVNNGIKLVVEDKDIIYPDNYEPVILFLSSLYEEKGIYDYLEALAILVRKGLKLQGKIIGPPTARVSMVDLEEKIMKIGLDSIVRVKGPVYGSAKYKEILKSDIFVFPTKNDTYPSVVLEAMQCARPVVSTYECAIPEIIDEGANGFLVNQGDVEALSEKIEILLKDKKLRIEMGKNGREKFLSNYTLDKFENNIADVFKNVLKNDCRREKCCK